MHTGKGPKYLGSHPGSATYQLCDFGQVTKPPKCLDFSIFKCHNGST